MMKDDTTMTPAGWRIEPSASGRNLLGFVQNPLPPGGAGFEAGSWRWNDPDAIAFDLDRKKRQLRDAGALAGATEAFGAAQEFLPALPRGVGTGFALLGGYMGHLETSRLEGEIKALEARLGELKGRPAP